MCITLHLFFLHIDLFASLGYVSYTAFDAHFVYQFSIWQSQQCLSVSLYYKDLTYHFFVFLYLICTLHIFKCANPVLLYVFNTLCLPLICHNVSSLVLGNKFISMLTGIRITFPSVLFYMLLYIICACNWLIVL